MIRNAPVFALVPARSGSKGVIGKNLRMVSGNSLLAHSIGGASTVSEIDKIYVSSDDDEILLEAVRCNATPHKRSKTAASDVATATDVLNDFIASLSPDVLILDPFIVYLQPTSPLRTNQHIEDCLRLIDENETTIVVSVRDIPIYKEKLLKLTESGRLAIEVNEFEASSNRQQLKNSYFQPNGAIYIFRISDFKENGIFPLENAVPFFMSIIESLDIDKEDDLALAERLMET